VRARTRGHRAQRVERLGHEALAPHSAHRRVHLAQQLGERSRRRAVAGVARAGTQHGLDAWDQVLPEATLRRPLFPDQEEPGDESGVHHEAGRLRVRMRVRREVDESGSDHAVFGLRIRHQVVSPGPVEHAALGLGSMRVAGEREGEGYSCGMCLDHGGSICLHPSVRVFVVIDRRAAERSTPSGRSRPPPTPARDDAGAVVPSGSNRVFPAQYGRTSDMKAAARAVGSFGARAFDQGGFEPPTS